jgi:hypothetical protein
LQQQPEQPGQQEQQRVHVHQLPQSGGGEPRCPAAWMVGLDPTPDPGLRSPTNFAGAQAGRQQAAPVPLPCCKRRSAFDVQQQLPCSDSVSPLRVCPPSLPFLQAWRAPRCL